MWAWQEVKSGVKQLFFHFCENNSLFSAVITKNMVAPFEAFSAVDATTNPASLNSSGNRETRSFVKLTPNTLNAETSKNKSGISEVKK